jgi:hypothetical protein
MNYYILPKKHSNIEISSTILDTNKIIHDPLISHNLIFYLSEITEVLHNSINDMNIPSETSEYNDSIFQLLNPYEFIFTKIPGSKLSISKLKPFSNIFYVFLEISTILSLFNTYTGNIKTIHYGVNNKSTVECMNMLRDDCSDIHFETELPPPELYGFNKLPSHIIENSIDFLYFELDDIIYNNIHNNLKIVNNYVCGLMVIFCHILTYQNNNGICIIRLDNLYYKPVLDIIFLLTNVYEKVCIIKPSTSNINSSERYIVCKHFISNFQKKQIYANYLTNINNMLCEYITTYPPGIYTRPISNIINNPLPYYFLNKIEESNIIIGYQQIEYIDQIINFIKNKNKNDRIEIHKKNNIQKCIMWCEKYKIPYNKIINKINIFLHVYNYNEDINIIENDEIGNDEIGDDEVNIILHDIVVDV